MAQREPVLTARQIYRSYRLGERNIQALQGVDIELYSGELVVVLGPSGSGKSTLLHVLSGLEAPESGEVFLGTENIYELSDRSLSHLRSQVFGFIFQSYNLIPSFTVQENVEMQLRIAGVADPVQRAKEMLHMVGLGERLDHRPGQLSGGEQQRVGVARALSCNPKVIFADEPTGNLDSQSGAEVMRLLSSLVRERGAVCLMVTHNPAWAELADRVLYLRDGRLGA